MIKDIKSVYNILNAINGKLRTPKIDGFNRLVDFLRLKGGIEGRGSRNEWTRPSIPVLLYWKITSRY
jgi:hypothetical protein